jgi:hypothetical protein
MAMPVGQEVRGAAIGRTLTAADVLRGKKAMGHGPRVEGAVVLVAAAVSLAATAAAGLVEVAAAAEKAVATMAEVVLTMVEVVVVVALVVQAAGRAVAGQAGVVAGPAAAAAKERKGIPTGRLGRADTARPGSSRGISYSPTALILRTTRKPPRPPRK